MYKYSTCVTEADAEDEELMDEWLEVLRKKKELVDREAKLMLKSVARVLI